VRYDVTDHDQKGFPLKITLIEDSGSDYTVFKYAPNTLEKISYHNEIPAHVLTDTWDSSFNLTQEKLVTMEGDKTETVFIRSFKNLKIDKQGNWIKREVKEEITGIVIREERDVSYF
jgi:hypothetical protein